MEYLEADLGAEPTLYAVMTAREAVVGEPEAEPAINAAVKADEA